MGPLLPQALRGKVTHNISNLSTGWSQSLLPRDLKLPYCEAPKAVKVHIRSITMPSFPITFAGGLDDWINL